VDERIGGWIVQRYRESMKLLCFHTITPFQLRMGSLDLNPSLTSVSWKFEARSLTFVLSTA